jgi:hypothetical protein
VSVKLSPASTEAGGGEIEIEAGSVVRPATRASALANSAAVAKRSAGARANAFVTACSTATLIVGRTRRREGQGLAVQ